MNTWPDGAMTPFRSEKNTNWEGAFRVPVLVRWPGKIAAGSSPTRSSSTTTGCRRSWPRPASRTIDREAAEGRTTAGGKTFKVHIDGYNLLPYLTGEEEKSPRQGFIYFDDDGDLVALRFDNWKVVFMEQRAPGTLQVWAEPFIAAAGPEALQPAHRPVRAGRHHVEHLLRLVPRPRLHRLRGAGDRDAVPRRRSRSSRRGRRRPASRSTRRWRSSRP